MLIWGVKKFKVEVSFGGAKFEKVGWRWFMLLEVDNQPNMILANTEI